jgi:GNAT superfamily N-acetyltransferase
MTTAVVIRDGAEGDVDTLAHLWHSGWQDAHAEILPDELKRLRTLESFRERLAVGLADVRTAERAGALLGFSFAKGDELYQFYVARVARGGDVSALLTADALATFRRSGIQTAWLACAIGNERAARFYEKHGWHRVGKMTSQLPTPDGTFPLNVWRYEMSLR